MIKELTIHVKWSFFYLQVANNVHLMRNHIVWSGVWGLGFSQDRRDFYLINVTPNATKICSWQKELVTCGLDVAKVSEQTMRIWPQFT